MFQVSPNAEPMEMSGQPAAPESSGGTSIAAELLRAIMENPQTPDKVCTTASICGSRGSRQVQ